MNGISPKDLADLSGNYIQLEVTHALVAIEIKGKSSTHFRSQVILFESYQYKPPYLAKI